MGLPGVVGVYGEAGNGARFSEVAEGLLGEGIDDLAKYRIILHLLQHPDDGGEASFFASTLGFHSLQRTMLILDELYQDGLLLKQDVSGLGPRYSLAPDSEVRRRLQRECTTNPASPEYELLLRSLAQRSVVRAKSQTAKRRKGAA
ncbi:MAG: hypothetical protein ACYC4L_05610 [Chloroflexota bacterium]